MLKRCARYSIMQEDSISELRSFIERNFNDVVLAMKSQNAGTSKANYQPGLGGDGKPSFDRMLSDKPEHLFDLYTSVVHDNDQADQYELIVELREKNVVLQKQIEVMYGELELCHSANEIWQRDAKALQVQIDGQRVAKEKVIAELAEVRREKDEKIRLLEQLVACNKENFEKDKARLNTLHRKE